MSGVADSESPDAEALDYLERCAKFGVSLSPMLTWWRRMTNFGDSALKSDPRMKYVPAAVRAAWLVPKSPVDFGLDFGSTEERRKPSRVEIERVYRLVAMTRQANVEILAGTDTGDPYTVPGATLQDELVELVRAGLTPREALASATVAPARWLGWRATMGAVEKGKVADAVLLDANPLENIANVRKISAVFARGRYYSRKDLDGILAAVK
jgi:hypothetical protein